MRAALIPALLALCWGLNWPIVKIMLGTIPPFTMRWLGLGAGALILLGMAVSRRQPLWGELQREQWPRLLVAGLLNVAAFNLCTAFAQLSTSTSRASVLTYTMPMISALMAWLLLDERPDRRRSIALVLGSAGIALLAWPVMQRLGSGELDARSLRGLAMPLLAATAWAAGTVHAKRWPLSGDRTANTGWQLLVGAVCGAVGAAWADERWPEHWPVEVVAAMTYHVVVATAFAYVIWFVLLERFSATVASLTTLAVPVVGVIGAMALVGDRPGLPDWIGFALVLGGATLVALKLGQPATSPPSSPPSSSK